MSPKVLPECFTVSALISRPGQWNESLVRGHFSSDEAVVILNIPLCTFPQPDSLLWHFDKRGEFSVKSAYKVALSIRIMDLTFSSASPLPLWKKLWNLNLPSKVKAFCWKACLESLYTLAFLP
ncbi:hypothetical protein ACOSQ2_014587 [Xanthoceras sorbifolium]